jgi:hypothetical protein
MKLHKRVLFWVTTVVVMVSIFATPVVALASTPRVDSNEAIYPMAVAPPLGVASTFVMLAGSGITVSGFTTISGDVGTFPTTTETGFAAWVTFLTGTNHFGDPVTQQAKLDLTTAYLDAAGRGPVTTVPTELGGTSKSPGIYDSASGTFGITGTLTLDAGGDPTALFIFKTAATLITATNSIVSLTNGAQACNVFWQVGSSATLGGGTVFVGNILALTDITVVGGVGSSVSGRILARNGAVTIANGSTLAVCTLLPPAPVGGGLEIFKFNDLNGNGVQDTGELPLAGRQVTITGPGGYSSSAITNAAGLIILTGLVPGTYIVTEIVPPGWTVITPNPQTVTVVVGGVVQQVRFAERQQLGPTVGGTVMPVDKGGLLIPWLGMAVLLLLATGAVLFIRRRNSR